MTTKTFKPMTRKQWEKLPAAVQYFHSWDRASQPLTMDLETGQAIERKPAKRTRRKGARTE